MKVGVITLMTALLFALPALAGTDPCTGPDTDSDGTVDICDNCSGISNPQQYDGDQDGYGDACDGDYSGATANNFVDLGDFGAFSTKFNTAVPVPTNCEYDHATNLFVDLGDFGAFSTMFNQPPGHSCVLCTLPAPLCDIPATKGTPCPTPGAVCP